MDSRFRYYLHSHNICVLWDGLASGPKISDLSYNGPVVAQELGAHALLGSNLLTYLLVWT